MASITTRIGVLAGSLLMAILSPSTSAQPYFGTRHELTNASTSLTIGQNGVALARAASGVTLAVWSDDRTGHHAVYGSLLDKTGTPLTPRGGFLIAGQAGLHRGDPRVAACGDVFLVVLGNGYDDGTTTDIYATRVLDTGQILDAVPIVVSDQAGVQHNYRTPASDGDDTFLVAFRTAADSIFGGINTMRISATGGQTLDPPGGRVLAMGGPAGVLKKNPSVVFGDDRFLVLWDDGRDGCAFAGEAGCVDVYGAFISPDTGVLMLPEFSVGRYFSCQEGPRAAFKQGMFLVAFSDERDTNCQTADVTAVRILVDGTILDPADPTGMVGGIRVATDPIGFPGSVQGAVGVACDAYTDSYLVTYRDTALSDAPMALRMKRVRTDAALLDSMSASDAGFLIDRGTPSTGVSMRADPVALEDAGAYVLAYTFANHVYVMTVYFQDRLVPTQRYFAGTDFIGGIAVGDSGRVYVSDATRGKVVVFEEDGRFAFTIVGSHHGIGKNTRGIAVDASENIYLADFQGHRIFVFDSNGLFLHRFGSHGKLQGQFSGPYGIAIDNMAERIFVTDMFNHRVQVFTFDGRYDHHFGFLIFDRPRGITIDCSGNRLITDYNHVYSRWDTSWRGLRIFYGSLFGGSSIASDRSGTIYIGSDRGGQSVVTRVFPSSNRHSWYRIPIGRGSGLIQHGVALDRSGCLYVTGDRGVVTRYEYTVW